MGPAGKVLAFEPNPQTASLLRSNIDRLKLGNVRVSHAAVADGHFQFRNVEAPSGAEGRNRGANTVSLDRFDPPTDAGIPATITLDSLDLEACRLIKIDAEGLSAEVIRGARTVLAKLRPRVVAEVNSLAEGAACLEAISGLGYTSWALVFDTYNPDNFNGQSEVLFSGREVSLLFLPDEDAIDPTGRVTSSRQHLIRITNLDDLAVALLAKPQYHADVLQVSRSQHCATAEFPVVTNAVEIALGADLRRRLPTGAGPFGSLIDQLDSTFLAQIANVSLKLQEQADEQEKRAVERTMSLTAQLEEIARRLETHGDDQTATVLERLAAQEKEAGRTAADHASRLDERVASLGEHLQTQDYRREKHATARAARIDERLSTLAQRLQSLEAWTALEKSQLEAAATELKNEVTQAASRATTQGESLLATSRELERLRHERETIKRSLSWQLTRPLRMFARKQYTDKGRTRGRAEQEASRKRKWQSLSRTVAKLSASHSVLKPLSLLLPKPERRLASDYRRIRAAGVFDPAWYGQQYEVPRGKDPLWYFLRRGAALGHAPSSELSHLSQGAASALRLRHGKAGKALQRYLLSQPATEGDRPNHSEADGPRVDTVRRSHSRASADRSAESQSRGKPASFRGPRRARGPSASRSVHR